MPDLTTPCLMLLTDRTLLPRGLPLAQVIAPAVGAGVNAVVLRETDLTGAPRLALARFARAAVRGMAPFIAAGTADFVQSAGADGAQVAASEVKEARAKLGANALIGAEVEAQDEAVEAERQGAGYLLVECDWGRPGAAIERLRAICAAVRRPVIAGGDAPVERIMECLRAGAGGVAVCGPIMNAPDPAAAARAYAEALKAAAGQA